MPTPVLFVLPDLRYTAAGQQVRALFLGGVVSSESATIAALEDGPMAEVFRAAGVRVAVVSSPSRGPIDQYFRLQEHVRELSPGLVHTWGLVPMRMIGLPRRFDRRARIPWIASDPFRGGRWTPADPYLIRSADRVTVSDEAQHHRRSALRPIVPEWIPLAVIPTPEADHNELKLPFDARVLLSIGRFDSDPGFRDAVWALDVIKYIYPTLYLILIGDPAGVEKLRRFADRIGGDDLRVIFLTDLADAARWVPVADVVVIPNQRGGGFQVLAEAKTAGIPVVAVRRVGMPEAVGDAGLINPVRSPVRMSSRIRWLLDDPDRWERTSRIAKAASARHQLEAVAGRWAAVYAAVR